MDFAHYNTKNTPDKKDHRIKALVCLRNSRCLKVLRMIKNRFLLLNNKYLTQKTPLILKNQELVFGFFSVFFNPISRKDWSFLNVFRFCIEYRYLGEREWA